MKLYQLLLPLSFILFSGFCRAQVINIGTQNSELVLSAGVNHKLYQSFYGKKIDGRINNETLQQEAYVPAGTDNLLEPAIRVIHADGNPSLVLNYQSYNVEKKDSDVAVTTIVLKDPDYAVEVDLHFETFYKEDIIKSWTEIKNDEKGSIQLNDYASSMLHFNASGYWLSQFHGDWTKELSMEESKLTYGIKILDSKLGTRANLYQPPFFMLSLNGPAAEDRGDVIAGTLAWTGNFQFLFEIDPRNSLRVISGINPYASTYRLDAGKSLITPAFIYTFSSHGKDQASRNFHTWATKYGVLDGEQPRLTLLNNWETTGFDFNEKKLAGIFDNAKKLGVDMFLLDDGWFGNKYPRDSDNAGLGDWVVNKKKLPGGIGNLVREGMEKGVKLGIWMEPEMVNPKSELYENHPDWILKLPNRPEDYFRNQLVLDLINPKVQDYVYHTLDNLLSTYPGIAYIKWDCNRMMTNPYSPYLGKDQSNLYVDYVKAFYTVLDRLRAKYPHLPMMLCSGGGGRTDYGGLKYFTEFWPSDDTDPIERIFIQWGYSYFFPSFTIASHVTSWGKQSLKFRTDVAMMGKLGYDINVSHMSVDELRFSQQAVSNYKKYEGLIWYGDMYHLVAPYHQNRAVLMSVDKQKENAIIFAYNLHLRYGDILPAVKLKGLDPGSNYQLQEINIFPGTGPSIADSGKTFKGAYLMEEGITVSSNKELSSTILILKKVPGAN